MATNMGMDIFVDRERIFKRREEAPPAWRFAYPNTADFNFNYWKLLDDAKDTSIGRNADPNLRVAVIGAGIAALTAARELFRSGFTKIDVYEASERLGGRTYSIPAPGQKTCFEMGAMRMPFFADHERKHNSVLDYYTGLYGVAHADFPNPGSAAAHNTGIYLNDGYGPAPRTEKEPELLIWKNDQKEPPTKELKEVFRKWSKFATMFTDEVAKVYDTDGWEKFWRDIVGWYWEMNFRDLVFEDAIDAYDDKRPGYFGGLEMTEYESNLFYTIGAGDGAWGAFYDIGCLYVMRTLLFGFGTDLQLIEGLFKDGTFVGGPQCDETLADSLGNPLEGPAYLGVETYADCMFYQPVVSENVENISLHDALSSPKYDVNLYTSNPVRGLTKRPDGTILLESAELTKEYDAVILTPTTWATELSMGVDFNGFDAEQWPFDVRTSFRTSHWIRSCKVFYPLKERYWGEGKPIPQIISTDNLLQGVYGYALEGEPGVLAVSYTWEDGASKLLADEDDIELAQKLLRSLDSLLVRSKNIGVPISPYVDPTTTAVVHWQMMPTYRGCAKLYRERFWNSNYALLRYNQEQSRKSGIYFAGEAFSVEGGWTEPALRGGLDATIQLLRNTGGDFLNGFDFERDYPRISDWSPNRSPKKLVVS